QGKSWKQELWTFLKQYRATPHSSTGIVPAEALYGRNIETEIPSMLKTHPEKDLREKDEEFKRKMKRYADQKRRVRMSDIKVNDKVLLSNVKRNAADPPFYPEVETVLQRKGDMITSSN
ncbi:hypothetical protein CAPTEDRAFT_31075, partial [Capitella teleta]